jgi:glucosamine--fructose-6-phosphate aminotransferase (isomerizing)
VGAGHERAVAATKTYTAELLALLMLVENIRGMDEAERRQLAGLPELAGKALRGGEAGELAGRYRFAARLVTTGRGYAYPTAREAALKLMETSYLPALAFSGADLLHGPLAMTQPDVPVIALVGSGPGGRSMHDVITRLREQRADVVTVGPRGAIPVPETEEKYAALLEILPLQQLALELALERGEDPDAPRALRKVTATM